jgi:uncharacterized protein DUF3159
VVYGAARPVDEDGRGLTEPSVRGILAAGLPGLLREGFLPLAAFYIAYRLWGLTAGIACTTAASALIYVQGRRAGREGLVVRLALVFVVGRALVGLPTHSTTAYLATPVLANAAWGLAFLGSIAVGRPLAGTFACAWYPFPPEYRRTAEFRRVFSVESAVWAVYLLAAAAVRATALFEGGVGSFVMVSILAGTPAVLALVAWSVWYATRKLNGEDN